MGPRAALRRTACSQDGPDGEGERVGGEARLRERASVALAAFTRAPTNAEKALGSCGRSLTWGRPGAPVGRCAWRIVLPLVHGPRRVGRGGTASAGDGRAPVVRRRRTPPPGCARVRLAPPRGAARAAARHRAMPAMAMASPAVRRAAAPVLLVRPVVPTPPVRPARVPHRRASRPVARAAQARPGPRAGPATSTPRSRPSSRSVPTSAMPPRRCAQRCSPSARSSAPP